MEQIKIKFATDTTVSYIKNNLKSFTKKVIENETNEWLKDVLPQPVFEEKTLTISKFNLSSDMLVDGLLSFEGTKILYNNISFLPRNVLTDERFWLWLYLDVLYSVARKPIDDENKLSTYWTYNAGNKRSMLYFNLLSRRFFEYDFLYDESKDNDVLQWVFEKWERFRVFTSRNIFMEKHIFRGCMKGIKNAEEEKKQSVDYKLIAKSIQSYSSVRLIDAMSEEEISKLSYDFAIEQINSLSK